MGHLLHIVLALGAQALVESGFGTEWNAPWAVLLLCGVPHALALLSRRLYLGGRFFASTLVARAIGLCSPALHLAALALFGWVRSLEHALGERISLLEWPRASLLAALAPFVVYELLAIDAQARLAAPPGSERTSWRGFQVRMLLSGLLPLAAYVLVSAAVGWSEELRTSIEEVSLYGSLFVVGMLATLALALPAVLRRAWKTAPIAPGPQLDVLVAVAERARFRCRALLVWDTGHLMANAAILGIGARHRVVVFSDLLLAQLEPRELAAVFAHEIGHAVRRHVAVFVVWVAAVFLAADLVSSRLSAGETWDPWLSVAVVVVAAAAWYRGFGFLSRRFELEADLFSLELLGDPLGLIGALERIGGRFRDVASWRHFSTAERVRFLARASADPEAGRALRRGLRRWTLAGCALLALVAVLQSAEIVGSLEGDRIRVDLRLGRYASAAERASRAGDLELATAALVARARSLGRDRVDVAELEREAERAVRDGETEAAREWLALAALRATPGAPPTTPSEKARQ